MRRIQQGLLALIVMWASPALAQNVHVTAAINPQRVYVGDAATFTITIHNSQTQSPPSVSGMPDLEIAYVNSSTNSSTKIFNGRRTSSNTQSLMYQATPTRVGAYVIPQQKVVVDGKTYITNQVHFQAIDPPESDLSPLRIAPERDTVYVGEPLRLGAIWQIGESIESFRFVSGGADNVAWTTGPQPAQSQQTRRVQWDNDTLVGVLGETTTSDGTFPTLNAERWFIPLAPGSLTIGPVSAVYEVQVGRQSRSMFGRSNTERRITRSDVAVLTVLPLPTIGQPDNFDGLVGNYTAAATATPLKVRVGDPITLTYEIRTDGPMGRVVPPDLESEPGVAESFKLDPQGWEETRMNQPGVRRYTTTIRALRDSIRRIPPLGFGYFDTREGEYRQAASRPIPLIVDKTREVTAADAVGGGANPIGAPAIERSELGAGPGGILANATSHDSLVNQQTLLLDRFERPVWIAAFTVPPAGYFALLGVIAVRRRADPGARKRAGARRSALALLRSSGDPERAIRTYLAMRFDRSAGALTESDCRALLGTVDSAIADELAGAMLAGGVERYSNAAGDPPDSVRTAELLRAVDKEIGR